MNICFLPGSLCDERVFADQIAAATAAGFRCQIADLVSDDSIEAMADRVIESTQSGTILVGLSLGAIVAAEVVAQAPGHVAALALIDTNLAAPDESQLTARRQWHQAVRSGEFPQIVADHLTTSLTTFPNRNSELIFAMAMAAGPAGFLAQNHALLHRHDRRDELRDFTGPVLVLSGADDHLCPPTIHADLADRIPGAHHIVLANAGHLSTIDQPSGATHELMEWLALSNQQINTQEGTHEHQYT